MKLTTYSATPTSPRSLFFFFFVVGECACFNQELSRSSFRTPWRSSSGSYNALEILTNLSASIFVTCSSHSLLLSLIGWISQKYLICRLLILSIFVLSTLFVSTFISFSSNISLAFMFALLFPVLSLPHMLVSPDKIIQTASHSCCLLSLGFSFFYRIPWTGNVYTQVGKFHNLFFHPAINFQLALYRFFGCSHCLFYELIFPY